jgi:predicted homoserine dehydrogenase-like protein
MSARQLDTGIQSGSPQPLKVGLIGIGNMGQHHARVLSLLKNVKLVGIADVNVENGLEAASKYKARFYEDYRDCSPKSMPSVLPSPLGCTMK